MRLLTKTQVAVIVGRHPESLMRDARAGRFPKPIKMGDAAGSAVRWDEDEIRAHIEARKAAR